jgi:hypothetical protein
MLSSRAGLDYCEGVSAACLLPPPSPSSTSLAWWALRLGLVSVAAAALTACSSSGSCSQRPCPRDLELTIKSATWQAGYYQLDLAYDAVHLVCDIAIPVSSTPGAEDAGAASGKPDYCRVMSGDPGQVDLEFGSTLFVRIADLPNRVHVIIHRDASLLADREFAPEYNVFFANGRECGECKVAAEAISIP